MNQQSTSGNSGYADHRVTFAREDAPGVLPSSPSWEIYSGNLQSALVFEGDTQIEAQRGVGSPDPQGHFAGPEDSTASIEYDLNQFFVDGSGAPLDAAGDAMLRGPDNGVKSTHTIVDRVKSGDKWAFTVVRGGFPNLDEISGDPGTGLPMVVSLEYEARRGRSYVATQPDGEALTVVSSSAEDTTQTLALADEGGNTTEDVSLDGTTSVTTSESFDSLDAFELDAETQGDVTIEDSSGNTLVTLNGKDSYDGVSGDLGVPAVSGHSSNLGAYESFLNDSVDYGGNQLAVEIRSASFSVDNNYDKSGVLGGREQAIHPGDRAVEFSATTAGEFDSHEKLSDHMQTKELDMTWEMDGGSVTFPASVLTEVGEVGPSAGDVISTQDNTWQAKGINVSSN